MKILFIILFNVVTLIASVPDTTIRADKNSNLVLLVFSEPIKNEDLLNKANYIIKDNTNKYWGIELIGVVKNENKNASDKVILKLNRLDYKKTYTIEVINVHDTAGNLIANDKNKITYYFDGYRTSLKKPNIKINYKKLNIIRAFAKDTVSLETTPEKIFDGIYYNTIINNGRWATSPNPEWLVFELEKESFVDNLNISFFRFEAGRIYNFSIDYSPDGINWQSLGYIISSNNNEFTNIDIKKRAKFIKINIISQNQNSWSSIWEIEVYGN